MEDRYHGSLVRSLCRQHLDPLEVVEAWYRKVLTGASETDLNNDPKYANVAKLSGIKLALRIDSVTIFRAANQSTTSIELFKCGSQK